MATSVIIDVNINAEDATKKANDLAKSIQNVKDQQVILAATGKKNSAEYVQNAQTLRQLQAEQKQYISLSQAEIGSNNQLRSQLALVTAQYNAMSKEERENTLAGKALQTQTRALTDELKRNEGAVGDNRRNVGNYRDALKQVGGQIASNIPGVGQYADQLGSLSGIIKTSVGSLNLFKIALASTGIGAIVVLLGSLIAYFSQTEEGAEKLERGMAGLKGAFAAFIAPLTQIGRILSTLFTNPAQALKDFRALLSGNILDNIKNFGKSVKDGFNIGAEVKQLEQDAEDAGRELNRRASKLRAEAAVLRAKGDKESLKKAQEYLLQSEKLTTQAVQAEIKAQQAYIDMRKKNGQDRDEDYEKLNSLYAKIDQSRSTDAAKAEKINARLEKQREKAAADREKEAEKERKADEVRIESLNNTTNLLLTAREKEFASIQQDIDKKIREYEKYGRTTEQLELEREARLSALRKQFQEEDLKTIVANQKQVEDIVANGIKDEGSRELAQLRLNNQRRLDEIDTNIVATEERIRKGEEGLTELLSSQQALRFETLAANEQTEREKQDEIRAEDNLRRAQFAQNEIDRDKAILAAKEEIRDQEQAILFQGTQVLQQVFGEQSKIAKLAFAAQKAYALGRIVIQTQEALAANRAGEQFANASLLTIPFAGIGLAAANSAKAAVQRALILAGGIVAGATVAAEAVAGFDSGGVFKSDGRGSVLPGYSRRDNVNSKLRSGEAVIVSEATRDPKGLAALSAINVAYGGRPLTSGFAMAQGGLASASLVGDISDRAGLRSDVINEVIAAMRLVPPPIVDVREITTAQQRNEAAVVRGVI